MDTLLSEWLPLQFSGVLSQRWKSKPMHDTAALSPISKRDFHAELTKWRSAGEEHWIEGSSKFPISSCMSPFLPIPNTGLCDLLVILTSLLTMSWWGRKKIKTVLPFFSFCTFPSALEHFGNNKISTSAQMLDLIHWLVAKKGVSLSARINTTGISTGSEDVPSDSVSSLARWHYRWAKTQASWGACLERQRSGVSFALNNM